MGEPKTRESIAAAAASLLEDGWLVNVGIGIPSLVPHHVADERGIVFHAEHGVVGFGSDRFGPSGDALAFFGTTYRMRPGGFICDSSTAFGMVRSGRLDATVLGTFAIGANGHFANLRGHGMVSGCPGGSPELAGASHRVIVVSEHRDAAGRPKLRRTPELPVAVARRADWIVTELGVFEPLGDRYGVCELAQGVTIEQVSAVTDAPVEDRR